MTIGMGTFRNEETGKKMRYFSFASKYAYFFIDPERFFILDSLGEWVVKQHDGERLIVGDGRYVDFSRRVRRLIEASDLRGLTPTIIDHYYWLRRMYDSRGELKSKINLEARLVLGSDDLEVRRLVRELLGER